ncbi:MAG: EAL domain-containing protein [Acidimicrobiales bacterium]|nr:EAL domain-containing protein [Acidimicrobiales bacterium]
MGGPDRASAAARSIALIYVAIASVWILLSDAVFGVVGDPLSSVWGNIVKGLGFVAVSGYILYHLIVGMYRRMNRLDEELASQTELQAALFNLSPEAMWVYDPETLELLEVNDTMVRRYGRRREELLSLRTTDLGPMPGSDRIVHFVSGGDRRSEPSLLLHFGPHGEHRWVEVVAHPIEWHGRVAMLALSRDITAQKRAEDALRASERRLAGVLTSMQEMAFSIDLITGRIAYLNEVAGEVLGRDPRDLFVTVDDFSRFVHDEDRDIYYQAMRDVVTEGWIDTEFRIEQPDGSPRTLHIRARGVVGPSGRVEQVDGVGVDMTHREELDELVEHQRSFDHLTGLPNRLAFVAAVDAVLAGGSTETQPPVVALFDLDRFGAVNQSAGHHAGDAVLLAVAERVTAVLSPGMMAARVGGDEFAVFSPPGTMAADELVTLLQNAVDGVFTIDDYEFFVTMSVGLAESDEARDAENMLRDAHLAMTAAKARAGGVEYFHPAHRALVTEQVKVEGELRRAVADGELRAVYQPLVSLSTDRVVGVEVLARWQHPQRGLVPAAEFIEVAERSGLIIDLGAEILDQACRQAADWRRRYGTAAPRVWVNLSRRELDTDDVATRVAKAIAAHGLPPSAVGIEVTETAFVADMGPGVAAMEELAAAGVELALDDFGTGWSSLQTLKSFPLSVVKIDRSFVANVGESEEDAQIIKAVIGMAKGMSLTTLAEGRRDRRSAPPSPAAGVRPGPGLSVGPSRFRGEDRRDPRHRR